MKNQQQRNAVREAAGSLAYSRIAFDNNTIAGQRATSCEAIEKMLHLKPQLL